MSTKTSNLNQELLGYFVEHLEEAGNKSPATIENITRDIAKFVEFAAGEEISSVQVKRYIAEIEKQYLESSFLSKLSSLRQFVAWLNLKHNPFWNNSWNQSFAGKNKYNFFYNYEEIFDSFKDLKFGNLNEEDPEKIINYLVLSFLYEFYLSIDELISLNIGDYNTASGSLSARGIKIEASKKLKEATKYYIQKIRPELSSNSINLNDPLFTKLIAKDSKAQKPDAAARIPNAQLRQIITKQDLRPLYIKKSRVIHLFDEKLSGEEVEAMLAIELSSIYEPFIHQEDYKLSKAYSDFHPRANK